MGASRYVYLDDCTVKKLTDKAALVAYEGEELWIPFSQMADSATRLREGDDGVTVGITEWLAEQKGIDVD